MEKESSRTRWHSLRWNHLKRKEDIKSVKISAEED